MGSGTGRNSQQTPCAIYCDEPGSHLSSDSTNSSGTLDDSAKNYNDSRADSPIGSIEIERAPVDGYNRASFSEYDDDYTPYIRRDISNITATSVSSLPLSALPSEDEGQYTPTKNPRPALRSPSIRRMHIGTTSSDRLSPHRSFRASSPKKFASMRVSPRPRTRERQEEVQSMVYPLVLLHLTVLPVVLPWSSAVMEKALPTTIQDNLALLKSRLPNIVLQRGLLVSHPQDDFEVLEERVLEALELRSSDGNPSEDCLEWSGYESMEHYSVSAEENGACCQTCGEPDCISQRLQKRWEVKVYAANGLMRAGAWAAAWSDMERVDLEILPHIPYDMRRRLDDLQAEEDREVAEEPKPTPGATGDERSAVYQDKKADTQTTPELVAPTPQPAPKCVNEQVNDPKATSRIRPDPHLPSAYRPKEIPLRILLQNYVYLLAQDRRNIAILFLIVTIVFSTLHGMRAAGGISSMSTENVFGEHDMTNTLAIELGATRADHGSWASADDVPSGIEIMIEKKTAIDVVQQKPGLAADEHAPPDQTALHFTGREKTYPSRQRDGQAHGNDGVTAPVEGFLATMCSKQELVADEMFTLPSSVSGLMERLKEA